MRYTFTVYIIAWFVAAFIIFTSCRQSQHRTVGLPLAYFTGLLLIHLVGAFLYVIPNYRYYDPSVVLLGFKETTIGVYAFCAGVLLLKLFVTQDSPQQGGVKVQRFPVYAYDYQLPYFYLGFGLAAYFIGMPLMGRLPTISSLVSGCTQLSVVAICLGIFIALSQQDKKKFQIWLTVATLFPLLTLLHAGFLGYGIHSLIIVIAFTLFLVKIRPRILIIFCLLLFLGLSFFVTYMRDRGELRDVMWHNSKTEKSKFVVVYNMFDNFEFFDINDKKHLHAIDKRLNQNHLVGAAIKYLRSPQISYAHGQTIVDSFIALVPRVLWPDKPAVGGGGNLVSKYTGIQFAPGTSVGAGQVLEFYVNFGRYGVVVGFFLLGGFLSYMDNKAAGHLFNRDFRGFVLWFLPGLGFLQAGGNFVEVVTTVGASVGSALLATRMAEKYYVQKNK